MAGVDQVMSATSGWIARVERVSTTEHVLRNLRLAIVSGELAQGEQLREVQLAAELGTGRGAVREALRHLVQEGLVEHRVHHGAFVRSIDSEDVLDVYCAREAIETAALEAICAASGPPDFAPLEECIERMRAAAAQDGGSWRRMVEADVSFHESLVALSGRPRLVRMYATLAAETLMHLYRYPPYPVGRNLADHEELLAAIKTRSAEAVELLRTHLRFSAELAADWLGP